MTISWHEKFKSFNKTDEGWFDYQPLYQHEINRVHSKATFVEIGTYHGESGKFMADQIEASGKDIEFYTVDNKTKSEVATAGVCHSGAVAPEFILNSCEAVPLANFCNPLPSR